MVTRRNWSGIHGNSGGGSRGYNQKTSDETREYDGHCPKCGREERQYDPYTEQPVGGENSNSFASFATAFQTIWCGHCGYTEWYQDDGEGSPVEWFAETDEE